MTDKKYMTSLRMHAPYDFRVEDIMIPDISDDEILIKVKACGICAGDIKTYHGGIRIWGKTEAARYIETPVVGGHEFYGEVVAVGKSRNDVQLGELVIPEQIVPCGECRFCQKGDYWMCQRHYITGFKYDAQGGFAEFCKLDKHAILHKLPPDFPVELGALIEPYSCSMHAVQRGNITENDVVVIGGLGCIGLGMVTIAKKLSPKLLIGLDLKDNRLCKAQEFGADYVFNPAECDVVQEIKNLTGGYGCDVYIEASGNGKSVSQGLESIANLGTYVQFGVFADEIIADWNIIGDTKEIDIHGSHLGPRCYKPVIEGIINGSIMTDGIVSHQFQLQDWVEAFEVAEKGADAIKVALIP